ncbi:beta-ketoacyl [acyl carrier protein] synthase domain-containing protein [Streptomyces pratensis]|uniref:beta-ketoacyl [acyl carrier protein] synthase domain-containing protein n=1 Tax=Streptomyces pratensis TaxID=1169025 RepID=UPI0036420240
MPLVEIAGEGLALPGKVRSREEFESLLYGPPGHARNELAFADEELLIDPLQFAISPRHARYIDPQQLLLLDVALAAFADAGLAPEELKGSRTGVYVGMTESDHLFGVDLAEVPAANLSSVGVGNNRGMAAGRISYAFDLRGPSMQVDSTCSSGLLALHLASAAIRDGEIDRALVVASHLVRSEQGRVLREATGAIDPGARCNAFTDRASGFVVGEGVVAFVLKAAPERADGPGVRVATAVNQDGRTAGVTVPNRAAQEDVVVRALRRAGVDPDRVAYVEAHGTGTRLGDPLEVSALTAAYRTRSRGEGRPLLIGSNKPRFGHLEASSGLLSLLVATTVRRTGIIPGTRSEGTPNPRVDWSGDNVRLVLDDTPLPEHETSALGVSAFGMSGTNVHAIVAPVRAK